MIVAAIVGMSSAWAQDPAALEAARKAAEQSIREGERHQLQSRYWQTYPTRHFVAVVPSYAEAVVDGSSWTLDLAGPYTLVVTRVEGVPDEAALARLVAIDGEQAVADRPAGRVYDVQTPKMHHRVAGRTLGGAALLIEVRAPRGELDGAIADRILGGLKAP